MKARQGQLKSHNSRPEPMPIDRPPCPRCYSLARMGLIRNEMVMPLPASAAAPMAKFPGGSPCCHDCASADALVLLTSRGLIAEAPINFTMARIAVGNERQEQLRSPGAPTRLASNGILRPSRKGDLLRHAKWLSIYVTPWVRARFRRSARPEASHVERSTKE
jgi:hypothetical protein